MMRTIWLAEEKRRMERQIQDASRAPSSQEEELEEDGIGELPSTSISKGTASTSSVCNFHVDLAMADEKMADEVAQQEDAELEAYFAMIESESLGEPPDQHQHRETPYGSDDEEYDNLFMDVIDEEHRAMNVAITPVAFNRDEEMMDMS
jgi:hypothetical protein